MYVCMHACVYVCNACNVCNVCMHACIYVCNVCMYVCNVCVVRMCVCMLCIYVCMYACNACVYVGISACDVRMRVGMHVYHAFLPVCV